MKLHSNIFGWEYVWRDFADSKGGKVISDPSKDGDPILSMQIPVEGTNSWVTIVPYALKGKSKSAGTSASMHYTTNEHFAFHIRTERGVDQIGKVLGMQDIQLGDTEFDHAFLIQGTDDGKVRNLFSDMHLRDLIMQNHMTDLRLVTSSEELPVEHRVPAGRNALVYSHDHQIDKFEQLEALFGIMTSVVHRLGIFPALAGEEVESEPIEETSHSNRRLKSPLLDMA